VEWVIAYSLGRNKRETHHNMGPIDIMRQRPGEIGAGGGFFDIPYGRLIFVELIILKGVGENAP
jgi:hypothetical protein